MQGATWGSWPPCARHKLQRHFDDSDWFPRLPSGVLLTGPCTEADAVKRTSGGVVGAAASAERGRPAPAGRVHGCCLLAATATGCVQVPGLLRSFMMGPSPKARHER